MVEETKNSDSDEEVKDPSPQKKSEQSADEEEEKEKEDDQLVLQIVKDGKEKIMPVSTIDVLDALIENKDIVEEKIEE